LKILSKDFSKIKKFRSARIRKQQTKKLMCCTEITSARPKGPKCLNNFEKWDGAQNHPILVLMPTASFK
jgi:hypothetical protein